MGQRESHSGRQQPGPAFYMPAMPPFELYGAVRRWWHAYRRRTRFRSNVRALLEHEDTLLRDLGYRREDLVWALRLPLRVDAVRALEERRCGERAGEG